MNKKGISQVVALTIIVLLGIIAVTSLWVAVKPVIAELSPATSCSELQLQEPRPIVALNACYNGEDTILTLQRSVFDKNSFNSLEFTLFFDDGTRKNFFCGEGCSSASILDVGERRDYYFVSEVKPQSISLSANGCFIEQIEITDC